MGKSKSKLGCVSSLFQCFGSKKHADTDGDGDGDGMRSNGNGGANNQSPSRGNGGGSKNGAKRVSIREDALRPPNSPPSDMVSTGSARSSVYFDASEGEGGDEWHNSVNEDTFDELFVTLQIDGQYFFNAKDDASISKEAFEGIQMYPPLPTTEPDPCPRSPITVSNMQTLLHTYQHSEDDIETQKHNDEANIAAGKAGIAMEHQAQRLMSLDKTNNSPDYMGESTTLLLKELTTSNIREKGFPGELTEPELEAVKLFQSELKNRDPIYNQIVRSLSAAEKEAYALCRFLRARKFDVEKVFELLDEAKGFYAVARENDFYPDLEKALGFSRPIFLSQYPAVFCGSAKNGCPVMYLKLGEIQPEGIKCIVSLDKVDRFFWNDVTYAFIGILTEGRRRNPQFVRTENITVYDLKGVSRSQISSDTFEMIKVGNQVMSSFPETLHCLLIINAPSWFGFVWSVVKKLIDARTASKIEVFTNAKAGSKRMEELIDNKQIPSCYGGSGPSLAEAASGSSSGARSKMVVINQLLSVTKKNAEKSYTFELEDEKEVTLAVYTRRMTGATVSLVQTESEKLLSEIDIVGEVDDEPYSRTIGAIKGPGSFTVKLKVKSEPGAFLLLGTTLTGG